MVHDALIVISRITAPAIAYSSQRGTDGSVNGSFSLETRTFDEW